MTTMSKLIARLAGTSGGSAFGVAWHYTGNLPDAQEVLQEGLYRAALNWRRFEPGRDPLPWFSAIVRNVARDWRKRAKRRRMVSLEAMVGDDIDGLKPIYDVETPLHALERMEASLLVHETLAALKPKHRQVLLLCDMQGLTYHAAALRLRAPVGTVRSRLSRARGLFREKWTTHCPLPQS